MPDLREVFEMTTRQMGEPDLDSWREQERRQRNASRKKKLEVFAVAAAIAVVAVVWIVGTRGGQDTTTPANPATTGNPADPTAKKVATGFVEAYGAFDADRAITYLAGDGILSGVGLTGARELRLLLSFLEAQGYKQMLSPCEVTTTTASGTWVSCPYDFHAIRSDEIGRGPFRGSYWDITVRDGEIVRVGGHFEMREFSSQMWDPFAEWVSTNYPEDVKVMYESGFSDYRLSEKSIRLWGQHTREYVNTVNQGTA